MTAPARLRQLRLVGFKSFAERTVVEFGPGISAVVGPNGSGKSNLADALRWALGEQGRSLRTRKSEDVIFAGSANRRATGMADVTLVVDNMDTLLPVDFSEVELGRRLFRSGENEYLLNRQRVRLRDLVELLDSANLADNAFLFIGQGMVDQALSLRPEERRPLFEEAAGVRRHERRRRAAEGTLVEAEANLSRVRDVLAELRPQLRRLAAQAEQQAARSTAAEELADAVVANARARWSGADRAEREAAARAADARAATERALADLRSAEEAAATLAARLAERAVAEREGRAQLDAVRARIVELRLTEGRATAEREGRTRDRERLTTERQTLVARATHARATASAPQVPIDAAAEDAVADLDLEIAAAAAELERARATGEREASLRRAAAAREAELERLQRAERAAATRAHESAERARAAAEAAEVALRARDDAVQRLDAAIAAERVAESTLEDARSASAEAEGTWSARAAAAAESRRRHDDAASRLRSLDDALAAIDGRGAAAAARRRGGTLLAEGAEVDPALRTAVEAALGAAASAVLAPSEVVRAVGDEAGALVVKEASAVGRNGGTAASAVRAAATAAGGGQLSDAIRHDPQGALSALVSTAVWVPDIDAALALLPSLPVGWRAATTGGDVVNADGLVELGRGGSTLARRAERDMLAAQLERLRMASEDDAGEADAAARERDRVRSGEGEARRHLAEVQAQRRSAEETARAAERRADLTAREAAWEDAQRDRLAREHERLRDELARVAPLPVPSLGTSGTNDAVTQWAAQLEELRRRRRDVAATVDVSRAAHREAEDRRRRAEVTLTIDDARLEVIETELGRLASLDEEARNTGALVAAELATAREQEKAAAAALDALGAADADERRRLAALEADASAARERLRVSGERGRASEVAQVEARLALEAVRESLLVELAALGPVGLRALNGDAHIELPAEVHEDELAAELEAALARATDAWRAAPDTHVPSSARLALLRRRFHEVGAANPFAAQEHAELKERVDALESQASDLVDAIDSTRRLIAELSALITDRFQQTFAALEQAFARQFELLFGGGDARLELTAPEDLTQTGVEILARPPGKKRQPLSMLSGGERALTAVALLFAMLEVRPVPFCVLDEVDAALDEANISRFAASLRNLADQTQFIVITHNRGTIESADTLYGVTIGDDAVSRVISLRLSDATDLTALRGPPGTAA